jgi:iron complex outermembrane receptor protein
MKRILFSAMGSVSLLAFHPGARAQPAAPPTGTADATGPELEEIVVTATRRETKLQDVPMAVTVVTSDAVGKLNLLSVNDIQQLVPGLVLDTGKGGFSAAASLRGITFDSATGGAPTVDMYLNETPIDTNYALQSMYDIGQIEVLKGPQGTLRGRPSPSGTITLTTHRPDLDRFDGYVSTTAANRDAFNGQGAFNMPIVQDVLALRVAGVHNHDRYDDVRSLNNTDEPETSTDSWRASLRYQPLESLEADLTYQYLKVDTTRFDQVYGTAAPGPFPPAKFNGSPIASADRHAVESFPDSTVLFDRAFTGQARLDLGSNRLVYIGGYSKFGANSVLQQDVGNLIPGTDVHQDLSIRQQLQTDELRFESATPLFGVWDYVAGAYYQKLDTDTSVAQPVAYLPGAFGAPNALPSPAAFDPDFAYNLVLNFPASNKQQSLFTNSTLHLAGETDLSVGGRYLVFQSDRHQTQNLIDGRISQGFGPNGSPLPAGSCAFIPPSSGGPYGETYPGFCDLPLANLQILDSVTAQKHKTWIYDAAVSHKFSTDLNAYFRFGHSWREGPVNIGVISSDPVIVKLGVLDPETSNAFELGAKSQWLEQRLQINVAVFQQRFKNYIFATQNVPYINGNTGLVNTYNFIYGVPAIVNGVDFDAAMQVTQNWSVSLSGSYAKGHIDNGTVPCQANGTPTYVPPGQVVAFCRSDATLSHTSPWNVTLKSELIIPVGTRFEAYGRGLFNYYSSSDNAGPDPSFTASAYPILNLYAGIRSVDQNWEVGLFAKNITDSDEELTRDNAEQLGPANASAFLGGGHTGYYKTSRTAQPSYGLTLRYSFGWPGSLVR